jgi:hypothetical protein
VDAALAQGDDGARGQLGATGDVDLPGQGPTIP